MGKERKKESLIGEYKGGTRRIFCTLGNGERLFRKELENVIPQEREK